MQSSYKRNISFSTTDIDYELLTNTNIKDVIKERLNINTDEEYNAMLEKGLRDDINFTIFCSDTSVKINNASYYNALIENAVYDSGKGSNANFKSIKIKDNGIDGVFSFTIG